MNAPKRLANGSVGGRRRVGAPRAWLSALMPLVLTAAAAALGYALAIFPIRHQAKKIHDAETVGRVIPDASQRTSMLAAYERDSGLDVAGLDRIEWKVPTVMTPFVGYAPAPGRHHNAFIDSHQFRGRAQLTTPKPSGVLRIFVTGASVAFGSGAPSDDRTIGAYLQRVLDRSRAANGRRYEVFTFATPDWWSTHERIAIENRISELEPDLVVALTGSEDCSAGESGKNVFWARSATDEYYWELANVALKASRFGSMIDVQDVTPEPVPPEIVASRLRKNLVLAAFALSKAKARLHVFFPPSIVATRKAPSAHERILSTRSEPLRDYYARCRERVQALFAGDGRPANVALTDLGGIFDAVPETESVFLDGDHFGDRGNSMIAEAIGKALFVDDSALFHAP